VIGSNIEKIKIGIAGAGGLGSNCAFNLVRSGFVNFKIYDFDIVEKSNLNRQFYFYEQIGIPKVFALIENLKRINSNINIEADKIYISKENIKSLFNDCDAVVEAFDSVECKKMIIEQYCKSEKLFVSASGISGYGDFEKIKVKKLGKKFFMVGDFEYEATANNPPFSPKVNIIAALEADIILNYYKNNWR